ncbi:hypothetical protein E2C01_011040 [Portunus trituberculatus]|uniref:Uncharacterized protein n=1 Tax=Portunus trituberculatus TaxID=210409 RepID=A0A5B7D9Z0_PORTR|nr:hypothetical protein [Portunus trituberculatus]
MHRLGEEEYDVNDIHIHRAQPETSLATCGHYDVNDIHIHRAQPETKSSCRQWCRGCLALGSGTTTTSGSGVCGRGHCSFTLSPALVSSPLLPARFSSRALVLTSLSSLLLAPTPTSSLTLPTLPSSTLPTAPSSLTLPTAPSSLILLSSEWSDLAVLPSLSLTGPASRATRLESITTASTLAGEPLPSSMLPPEGWGRTGATAWSKPFTRGRFSDPTCAGASKWTQWKT